MKQFYLGYTNKKEFLNKLKALKTWCGEHKSKTVLFQIYSELMEQGLVTELSVLIEEMFPQALYVSCSANGNILNGQFAPDQIMVSAQVFEKDSSCVRIMQCEFDAEKGEQAAERLVQEIRENPWVKAVELFMTVPEVSTAAFCRKLQAVREDVQIFGGVACSSDINSSDVFVASKGNKASDKAIAFVLYGGEEFYVTSMRVTGWHPLGKTFQITRAEGDMLYELDGKPAYNIYRDYLNINNDNHFFYNTLEFPLLYEHHKVPLLRIPLSGNQDGSMVMSGDMESGSVVRIAYGNPSTILETVAGETQKIRDFMPQVLHIFSCAARRTFWNSDEEAVKELRAFKTIAPMAGFFTHGEFLREKGYVNQHNVTLVAAAMREGEPENAPVWEEPEEEACSNRIPIVTRLSTFVGAVVAELEAANKKQKEANRQLEFLNEKLAYMAVHDGLTDLYNRTEIQHCIRERMENSIFSLIMIDIDNFKRVNDRYGHQMGDEVILALADILRGTVSREAAGAVIGRWGGEEFMLLLPDVSKEGAAEFAEKIRRYFAGYEFKEIPGQTISLGVAEAKKEEEMDALLFRVDAALYDAKAAGKNCVRIR